MMKATKDMLILDVLRLNPDVAGILMGHGLHCIGCMLASNETVEQACMVHGIDCDVLMDDVNAFLEKTTESAEDNA